MNWICHIWSGLKSMTNGDRDNIDLELYPNVRDVVESAYKEGKNLYIELKKPTNAKIIATIKPDYSSFRKEIERRLKGEGVEKEDAKNILHMVDFSHDIIYKDTNVTNDSAEKGESDQSDHNNKETKFVNVSE